MKESKTLSSVIQDMRDREELGKNKYGTTVDRKDLSPRQWMQHHYEELLDAALYVKRQIMILDGQGQSQKEKSLNANRSWISVEDKLPSSTATVRVRTKDGAEYDGFYPSYCAAWYVAYKRFPYTFDKENKCDPVVAWQEALVDETERG